MTSSATERPAGAITHPKCGSWWVGRTVSHCANCCESFSGVSTFDKHQSIDEPGLCRKPTDVGLVAVQQPWGTLWCRPGTHVPTAPEPEAED